MATAQKTTKAKAPARAKVSKTKVKLVKPFVPPVRAGLCMDDQGKLIGQYLYLCEEEDQAVLDTLCRAILAAAKADPEFFITLDLETNSLLQYRHDTDILLHSLSWDGVNAIVFEHQRFNLDLYLEVLRTVPISNQNIKFDAKWILEKLGVRILILLCTQVGCQLGYAGAFPGGLFGLDSIVKNLLVDYRISKGVRKEFVGKAPLTPFTLEQIEYAARDSLTTYRVTPMILARLRNQKLMKIWEEVELPLLNMMIDVEMEGIDVDKQGIDDYYDEREAHLLEVRQKITDMHEALPDDKPALPKGVKAFNPGSGTQIAALMNYMGINIEDCKADTLLAAKAQTPHEILDLIVDARKTKDQISKQLKGWKNTFVYPETNKIYPVYHTHGAETGRLSASEPPIHQTTKKMRKFLVAPPGWKFITRDFSQYEMRAAAGIAGEDYLLQVYQDRANLLPDALQISMKYGERDPDGFTKDVVAGKVQVTPGELDFLTRFSETDAHKRNAALVFGKLVGLVTGDEREIAKCVALDTLVSLEDRTVVLKDLLPKRPKAGQYYPLKNVRVLTDVGYTAADQIYYKGRCQGFRVLLSDGRSLVCSDEHKWRTLNKRGQYTWVKTKDLKPEQTVFSKMDLMSNGGRKPTEDGMVRGALLGQWLRGNVRTDGPLFELPKMVLDMNGVQQWLKQFTVQTTKVTKGWEDHPLKSVEVVELLRSWGWEEFRRFTTNSAADEVRTCLRHLAQPLNNQLQWLTPHKEWAQLVSVLCLRFRIRTRVARHPAGGWVVTPVWSGPQVLAALEGRPWTLDARAYHLCLGVEGHRHLVGAVYDAGFEPQTNDRAGFVAEARTKLGKKCPEAEFLATNDLTYSTVISVEPVGLTEMADLSVPEGHTLVYNGYVTHNTLGYAILYGSTPKTMQIQLAKKDFHYSLDFLTNVQQTFFSKLPKISAFIREVHRNVRDGGYLQATSGRRRFFDLPPRYMTYKYQRAKADADREAVNYYFQSANAHATKKAMVRMTDQFSSFEVDERPVVLINLHDEIVCKAPDHLADWVFDMQGRIMVEEGELAINNTCVVECSGAVSTHWEK